MTSLRMVILKMSKWKTTRISKIEDEIGGQVTGLSRLTNLAAELSLAAIRIAPAMGGSMLNAPSFR